MFVFFCICTIRDQIFPSFRLKFTILLFLCQCCCIMNVFSFVRVSYFQFNYVEENFFYFLSVSSLFLFFFVTRAHMLFDVFLMMIIIIICVVCALFVPCFLFVFLRFHADWCCFTNDFYFSLLYFVNVEFCVCVCVSASKRDWMCCLCTFFVVGKNQASKKMKMKYKLFV